MMVRGVWEEVFDDGVASCGIFFWVILNLINGFCDGDWALRESKGRARDEYEEGYRVNYVFQGGD